MNGAHAGPMPNEGTSRSSRQDSDLAVAARSDASILVTGRPGPARNLAYRVHLASGWRQGTFTVVDCASGDPGLETVVLDALFDESLQAPAVAQRRLVEAGTVLLQQINALPLGTQRRLAARLSDHAASLTRARWRRRIIASTAEPLLPRVLAGTFDDSLYYRLNVIHFVVRESD